MGSARLVFGSRGHKMAAAALNSSQFRLSAVLGPFWQKVGCKTHKKNQPQPCTHIASFFFENQDPGPISFFKGLLYIQLVKSRECIFVNGEIRGSFSED